MPSRPSDAPLDAPLAWGYADITVGFVDIVGFTEICAELPPLAVVTLLDDYFTQLDALCEHHRLSSIKTIGDAYMLAGGLAQEETDGHADRMLAFALEVLLLAEGHPGVQGSPLRIRVGLATGPVVAGVLRGNRMQIDLWGDTVNVASRLCDQAMPLGLAMDEITYLSLSPETLSSIVLEAEAIEVEGRGRLEAYRYALRPLDQKS